MTRPLSLWGLLLLLAIPATSHAQEKKDWSNTLGQAWTWMEAGALDKADGAFKEVVADQHGRLLAEGYFGLAAVWWQKRNAMASYQRLLEAKQLRGTLGWDGGKGDTWDVRIDQRMRYIERNFSVVKLRAPSKAAVPPLSDPEPADPLLKEFTGRVEGNVGEGLSEGSLVQWLMLPNGTYWVGDELKTLDGGEMNPSRAIEWVLDKGSKAKAAYKDRRDAIAAGRSPAKESLAQAPPVTADPADSADVSAPSSSGATKQVVEVVHRSIGFGIQGGFAPTRSLDGLDSDVAADWTLGVHLEGRLPLPPPILALSIQGGWKVLPVNGCRAAPTRAHLLALGAGPSIQLPLAESTSLGVDVAVRGGLAFGGRSDAARLSCLKKVAALEDSGAVVRGALASEGGVTGSFSMADIGWRGRAGAIGAEVAVGPILDWGGPMAISVQLHLGYDHLIPILPGETADTLYIRDPRTGDMAVVSKGQAQSAASMGRMQAGARVRVLF